MTIRLLHTYMSASLIRFGASRRGGRMRRKIGDKRRIVKQPAAACASAGSLTRPDGRSMMRWRRASAYRRSEGTMSNTGLALVAVLLAVCAGLAWTNPTTKDYQALLEASLSRALDQMDRTETMRDREVLRNLLRTRGHQVLDELIRSNTVRRNFGLFSIFDTRVEDVRVRVVGIANRLVPIDDVEVITRKMGQLML